MKSFKKILPVVLLLAMAVVTLSACNLFGKNDPDPTPTPGPGGSVTPTPPNPDKPDDISDATSGLKYKLTGNTYSVVGILSTNTRTDIVIPETYNGLPVDTVGYNAFEGATKVKTITLGENITSVGDFAFKGCSALRTINLNKVNSIGNGAFRGCVSLQFVTVSEDNERYSVEHNVLYNKDKTTLVLYPTSNYEYDNFSIPKTVETIRGGAFESEDLQLEVVLIGTNVKEVSYNAFIDCLLLKIYYIPDSETGGVPAGWNADWHNLSADKAKENISAFNGRECEIKFDVHGGNQIETVLQYENFYISQPDTPVREGYRFDGWYSNDQYNDEAKVKFPYQVKNNETLHAKWVKRCTITFETFGGTEIESIVQDEGYTVLKPTDPVRENYRFDGWYIGQSEFSFDSVVSEDLTIEARWVLQCHVVFDYGFGEDSNVYFTTQPKDIGYTISQNEMPKNPSRLNYKFMGWYTEKDGQGVELTDADFPIALSELEKVYYAYWKESYTVVFDSDNGDLNDKTDVAVLKGDSITSAEAPETPVYENYRFDGWFSERNGTGTEFAAGETVFDDATPKKYYAKWVRQYVVTVDTNGGPAYGDPYKVDVGSTLEQPNSAYTKKKGHDFKNWQIDGQTVDFASYKVQSDVTLVACYDPQQYNIVFVASDDVTFATINNVATYTGVYTYGTTVEAADVAVVCPTRSHRFVEWQYGGVRFGNYDDDGKFVGFDIDEEYPDGLTLTAKWQKQHRVELVLNASESSEVFVDEGQTLQASDISTPVMYGYVFDYWYDATGRVDAVIPTGDLTLTAKWHLDVFDITYRIDGYDDEVNSIEYLTKIYNFVDPVIDGYVVSGWLHEDGTVVTMPYTVEGDETIVAKLTKVVSDESYFDFTLDGDEYHVALKSEVKNNSEITAIRIPDTYNGKMVTRVKTGGFKDAVYLEKVELGNNIGAIESDAFAGCSGLKVMYITSKVTAIEAGTFKGCTRLTKIAVDAANISFANIDGDGLLYKTENDNYVLVAYPAGRSEETLTLSDWVGDISDYAFDGAKMLKTVNVQRDNVFGEIGVMAFNDCASLEAVNVNNEAYVSVDGVVYSADETVLVLYPQNKAGTEFTVPEGVTKINRRAFWNNNNLVEITIGKDVSVIGAGVNDYDVFGGAKKLERFVVDAQNAKYTAVDGVLFGDSGATLRFYPSARDSMSYVVPATATKIERNAFAGALNLGVVYIPETVVTISASIFKDAAKITKVNVAFEQADVPSGWNYGWSSDLPASATVNYGVTAA